MINDAKTFVYRNRLASLIKIDPELFPPFRQLSPLKSADRASNSLRHQAYVSSKPSLFGASISMLIFSSNKFTRTRKCSINEQS